MKNQQLVFSFNEGNKDLKNLLGGKGANLAEMKRIGLPVPGGFTVSTEACNDYLAKGHVLTDELRNQIFEKVKMLEEEMGKKFGDLKDPLLVSVRSGARVSMPGMMDTVLNLGLNDSSVEGMATLTKNPRLAYDSYRRFIQMFGDVVLSIPKHHFDRVFDRKKESIGTEDDTKLSPEDLKDIIEDYKEITLKFSGKPFPQDPYKQLLQSVEAVFKSFDNHRARVYRELHDLPHDMGTAVNVQTMVFGNMGETSATGVAFSRNPSTGENKVFGEFLINAQGEDVVAGIRTPKDLDELKVTMPETYRQFIDIAKYLENHYQDMQDIEFTVERGKLYILQTRTGKRTSNAAVNIAVDMVSENLIDIETAIERVDPYQLEKLLHPTYDEEAIKKANVLGKGLPASPGAATGRVYFHAEDVVEAVKRGEDTLLVRTETSPEDIKGMAESLGILTSRGGMTSHAAVVARGMGKCCVAGCGGIRVNEEEKWLQAGDVKVKEGEYISLNGNTGEVYLGKIATRKAEVTGKFKTLMSWAEKYSRLKVRANADTPKDAKQAIVFGAEGIGLCRTEHMFFDEDRIDHVREMILSNSSAEREKALSALFQYQMKDFEDIFEVMTGKPVNIRLLDPPLHEFLPSKEDEMEKLAARLGVNVQYLKETIAGLSESNPMLGHRGCRLGITFPEIYEMQVRAIVSAAIEVKKRLNIDVKPEIMIPLVSTKKELEFTVKNAKEVANYLQQANGVDLNIKFGTMIETPRACVTADEIAPLADFFSFGTNDLTQMSFGFSRDDAAKFLPEYKQLGIIDKDPFATLDQDGVGKLVKNAVLLGKQAKDNMHYGICGEHGGDPKSIDFCHRAGLDYVSCSPFRVPIARLAAAQSAIRHQFEDKDKDEKLLITNS